MKTTEIGARVSPELLAALDQMAKEQHRSRADVIRMACENHAERYLPLSDGEIADWLEEAEEYLDEHLYEEYDEEAEGQAEGKKYAFRKGLDRESVIRVFAAHIAAQMRDAEAEYYAHVIEQAAERRGFDHHDELQSARGDFDFDTVIWETKYGTEAAYDQAVRQEEERQRLEQEARNKLVEAFQARLPQAFLDAMDPDTDYGYTSPEFPEVVRRERKASGLADDGYVKGYVSQTLDRLLVAGMISKSGTKPRKLRKIVAG